ncbi:uncharacterized protein LOC124380927 [Silurus meridionalis]|uniref:uncharacterized protein LOC124380927 n=1 Tax=Silurus meridionalis TaxID=175797 RepID=UPI001EEA41AD|nr:uncharacterized protein LOC124380927 [Silurus meridionalis]
MKSTVQEEGTAEGESSLDLQEAKECNAPDTAEVPPKTTRRSKKLLTNLAATRKKKCNKPEAAADIKTESQYENNHESILTAAGSPVQDERLQMQAAVVLEKTPPRQLNSLSPSKVQCKNQDLEPSMSSNASSSSIECSTQQTRKQRAGRVKRDLSTSGKLGSREKMIDQDVAEPVSTMGLLEQIIQESENPEEDNSMNENLIDLSCLPDLDSQMFQRRPMVVLSREEVDMVFHAPDHSDDEDPSVSPLDLSLNTELSFPLQCSKLLMDDEEAEVEDCVFEENEERTNERASCEERTYEDLELTESAQAQPDISNIRDIPSCLKSEVCSQPEVGPSKVTTSCSMEETKPHLHPMACKDGTTALESSPPLVDDNVDPFCKNPDTPMAQETTTSEPISHGTSLVISNVMEQSEKYMPPILPKESAPASSEITPYSKPTPIESELGSLRSLQATQEPKEELQTSLEGQTWDTLHDLSENIKGTQESLIASPEVKVRMQGCAVAPELKEDFQEDVSVQASSAAGSSELCIKPTRRSRILKPKPNLSQKSRGPALLSQRRNLKTHSTFEPKSSQPSVSTERLPHSPATDQHNAFEDISMQKLNKDVETSQSHAMDQMESESVPDLSDSSTAVPDLQSVAAVTQNPASTDEPHVASECSSSKFVGYVGKIPPCTSLPFPPPSQTREDTGVGQMIVPSEDVCAPAEILQLTEDGHNGEEPTFILTLYEIPVKQTYLPSSSNDCVMALDLPTVEKQASLGFSDQTHILSTSESFRTDSMPMEGSGTEKVYLQNDLGVITKDLAESSKEQISAHTSPEILSPQTKDEGTSVNLHSGSECTETLPQDHVDTQQCETVSHLVPGDLVVPVSEKAVKSKLHSKEDSTVSLPERQDTPCEELAKVGDLSAVSNPLCLDSTEKSKDVPLSSEKKKAPARRRERLVKPQPKLVKRAHAKVEESSPQTTTQIVLPSSHGNLASISNTTDEKSVESISSIEGNMTSVSKGKELKPKSTAEESPKMSQGDLDLESKHISSALQLCRNPKLEEESRGNIPGHTIIKDDMKSSAEDKELSMAMPNEGAIVQPCCEDRRYSLMKASGSSTVDSEKTEAERDWSLENSLPRAGEHFQKELKIENVSQTLIEDSPQSPLMDNNSCQKEWQAGGEESVQ